MSMWECHNEAPKVYQFVGNTPEQVMRECADFLEQARDRGEYLTQWNIAMGEPREDFREVWHGTLTTNGAGFVAPWETPESDPLLQEWERELLESDFPPGGYSQHLTGEDREPVDVPLCQCSGCNDPWGPGDF